MVQNGMLSTGSSMMSTFLKMMLKSALAASLTLSCSCIHAQTAPQQDLDSVVVQAKLKFCELMASYVESMAVERNKGVPLSDLYARLPDSEFFPRAENLKAAKFVYANPDRSPSDFKKALLSECYKKVQSNNGLTTQSSGRKPAGAGSRR